MKAVFEYKGVKTAIDVPMYLFHINDLTDKIADSEALNEYGDEIDISEAYDYLEESLRYIFAKHQDLEPSELYCDFHIPQTEEEQEFGCLIKVHSDEETN